MVEVARLRVFNESRFDPPIKVLGIYLRAEAGEGRDFNSYACDAMTGLPSSHFVTLRTLLHTFYPGNFSILTRLALRPNPAVLTLPRSQSAGEPQRLTPDDAEAFLRVDDDTVQRLALCLAWGQFRQGRPFHLRRTDAQNKLSNSQRPISTWVEAMYVEHLGPLDGNLQPAERYARVEEACRCGPWWVGGDPRRSFDALPAVLASGLGGLLSVLARRCDPDIFAPPAGHAASVARALRDVAREMMALRVVRVVRGGRTIPTLAMVPEAHLIPTLRGFNSYAFDPDVDVPEAVMTGLAYIFRSRAQHATLAAAARMAMLLQPTRPLAARRRDNARLSTLAPDAAWSIADAFLLDGIQAVFWRAWHGSVLPPTQPSGVAQIPPAVPQTFREDSVALPGLARQDNAASVSVDPAFPSKAPPQPTGVAAESLCAPVRPIPTARVRRA